jgi:hypothetical protein
LSTPHQVVSIARPEAATRELLEIERAERREEQQHRQHEAEVADPIDDERLLAASAAGFLVNQKPMRR